MERQEIAERIENVLKTLDMLENVAEFALDVVATERAALGRAAAEV